MFFPSKFGAFPWRLAWAVPFGRKSCLRSFAKGPTVPLARYRSRLLLGPIPEGMDRNTELKRRLQLWEAGSFNELCLRVAGQQAEEERDLGHDEPLIVQPPLENVGEFFAPLERPVSCVSRYSR